MINDTVEEDITREVVERRLTEWFGKDDLADADLDALTAAYQALMNLNPENGGYKSSDRALFLRGIAAFVCDECGRASCLCGYPDD